MDSVTQKKCLYCKEYKDLHLFDNNRKSKDGKGWRCKSCGKKTHANYYIKNKEKIREANRRYKQANPEKHALTSKKSQHKYYRNNVEKRKDRYLRKTYGISQSEYAEKLKKQNEVCEICGNKNRDGRMLSVDHDHKNGKVRGLLCQYCNAALGMVKDDTTVLTKLISYIERYKE